MKDFFIDRNDSVLMVIDIQERLFVAMDEQDQLSVEKNSGILMQVCAQYKIPIVVTEQYRKGLGPTILGIQQFAGSAPVYDKRTFDCLKDAKIAQAVGSLERKTFILCGIESHICVFQTAMSLLGLGHKVIVAGDAVSSRKKASWKMALHAMRQASALVYPVETIAFMLIGDSSSPEFKELSGLFK